MRLFSFEIAGRRAIGAELGGQLVDLPAAYAALLAARGLRSGAPAGLPVELRAFLKLGEPALAAARDTLAFMARRPALPVGERATYLFDEVTLRAPVPGPGKILCCRLNHRSHHEESPGATFPENPRFLVKTSNTVIGPDEPIRHPGERHQLDCEVVLAVVIGRTMPQATPAGRVMEHVAGYTILNDVSSRFLQFQDNDELIGKNFDSFCPIGPSLVVAAEIPDPAKLRLRSWINGRVMQDGTGEDWIFPLPRLLARLSEVMTLEPGDIVGTGTPAGSGWFRQPQVFLRPGDRCRMEIEGIGVLENPVAGAADSGD